QVIKIIADVRKHKTDNNMSMAAELEELTVPSNFNLKAAEADILGTTRAKKIHFEKSKPGESKAWVEIK
ncbi:MAG: hypothetical protein MI867_30540, partial [Pseudomonadales bacterium]|nr:hypothetical protein [Pseudomonadales bacterium]